MGLSCLGLSGFLGLGWLFLSPFKEVFNYYLLKYLLMVFLFVFFFWDPYDSNVVALNIVLEVSEIVLISFNSFFFFPSLIHLFLSFYLLPHLSYLLPPCFYYWLLPECFFISFVALFIIYWLFFISPRSLLNLSCIFSILVSRLFICDSIFMSRF